MTRGQTEEMRVYWSSAAYRIGLIELADGLVHLLLSEAVLRGVLHTTTATIIARRRGRGNLNGYRKCVTRGGE